MMQMTSLSAASKIQMLYQQGFLGPAVSPAAVPPVSWQAPHFPV
jgi:hypothetical protein